MDAPTPHFRSRYPSWTYHLTRPMAGVGPLALGLCLTLGILLAPSAASVQAAPADEPMIRTKVSDHRVYEGEPITLDVQVSNVPNAPQPTLESNADFDVQFIRHQDSNFRQRININGRITETHDVSRHFFYRLTPKKTGNLVTPTATIDVDGQTLRSRQNAITVEAIDSQDMAQLEIHVKPSTVYPLQEFTVTLDIYLKALPDHLAMRNPASFDVPRQLQIPWARPDSTPDGIEPLGSVSDWLNPLLGNANGTTGFSIAGISQQRNPFSIFEGSSDLKIPFPSQRVQRADAQGVKRNYWKYSLSRQFRATKPGTYTLGPVTLQGTFASLEPDSEKLIGEKIYAMAKAVTLEVKPVPSEGRPDSFTGAIGSFQLSGKISPTQVSVGDPMTLTLRLVGKGLLDDALPPDLKKIPAIADNFRIYNAIDATDGNVRTFTYSLRPLNAGLKEFPPVPLSYFDVNKGKYVTLHTNALPIEVKEVTRLSGTDIVSASPSLSESASGASGSGPSVQVQSQGVYANHTDSGQLRDQRVRPVYWLVGMGGLVLGYAMALVTVRQQRARAANPAAGRRRAALTRAQTRLGEGKTLLKAGDVRGGSDQVRAAFAGVVADLADRPEEALTGKEIRDFFAEQDIEGGTQQSIQELLDRCDASRYGMDTGSRDLGEHAQKALDQLGAQLKAKGLLR